MKADAGAELEKRACGYNGAWCDPNADESIYQCCGTLFCSIMDLNGNGNCAS